MPSATVDLRQELVAIGQRHSRHGADGGRAVWMNQAQSKERAGIRRLVFEKVRWSPLVCCHEIQPAIVIDVSDGDSARQQWFGQTQLCGNIVVLPVRTTDEKRIAIMPAEVCAQLKRGPEARIVDDLIVAGAERLQFRPAIDLSFDKSA